MATFAEALKSGITQALCTVTSVEGNLLEMWRKIIPAPILFPNIPQFFNQLFCNRVPTPPPSPPFTGGQCEFCYRIQMDITVSGSEVPSFNGDSTQVFFYFGPLSNPRVKYTGTGGSRFANLCITQWGVCPGTRAGFASEACGPNFGVGANGTVTFRAITITPRDGQNDNCGSPIVPYPPYVPGSNTTSVNITYNDNNGNTFNVPIIVAFGYANISPEFNVNIPFKLTLNGTLNLTGNLNLSTGDINFNFGGNGNQPDYRPPDSRPGDKPGDYYPPTNPPTPTNPAPNPDPDEPDDPSGELIIRAALVVVTDIDDAKATVIGQDGGNPDIYAPSLGFINFYYRSGSLSGWSADIPVKNTQTIIPVPWEAGAIDVKGTPGIGVTWAITPIYGRKELPVELMP